MDSEHPKEGLKKVRSGSLVQVDFLAGQVTFKAFKEQPRQAICESCLQKGQAWIQVFFEPWDSEHLNNPGVGLLEERKDIEDIK